MSKREEIIPMELDEHQQRVINTTNEIFKSPEIQLSMAIQAENMYREEMLRYKDFLMQLLKCSNSDVAPSVKDKIEKELNLK